MSSRRTRRLLAAAAALLCGTAGPAVASAAAPAAAASTTTVTVDAAHPLAALPADFLGLSFESSILPTGKLDGSGGNLTALLDTLTPGGHLRFGGNLMDNTTWWQSGGRPVPPYATAVVSRPDIDRLAILAGKSGWKVELGANLKHLDTASVTDEAGYAAAALGPRLLGMECGNEPDLYPGYTYASFHASWTSCADAVGSRARMLGPDFAGVVPAQFLADEGGRLAESNAHYYPLTLCNGSTADLGDLLSQGTVGNEAVRFGTDVATAGSHGKPFRMDETNSVSCGGAGQVSNVYGSALWGIDYMLLGAQMGVDGMNFHGGLDICATNYSALCAAGQADLDAHVYSASPLYYAMLMTGRMGSGTFLPVGADSSAVRGYAVRGADGNTRVMLLNKAETGGAAVPVHLAGLGTPGTATAVTMTGTNLTGNAAGIRVQGAQVGRDGRITVPAGTALAGSGGGYDVNVPTGSAVLVTVPTAGSTAPPLTVGGSDLVGRGSNRCVDISGFRTTDYVPVQLYDCKGTWNQKWTFTGGQIVNTFTHKCLDVSGGRTADGTAVQQWTCLGNTAQQWAFRPDGTVVNTASGKCLDAVDRGTANNTRLQIWACGTGDNANQKWALQP